MILTIILLILVTIMLLLIRLKLKKKTTVQICNNGRRDVEIMVALKYLSNFWRTLEILSINCEMYLDLNWSANCVIVTTYNANQLFSITDTKFYVSIVTLSTQDNAKLLAQIKSGFKRTINCNFVSSFENNAKRVSYN